MLKKALIATVVLLGLYVLANVVLWVIGAIATIVSAAVSLAILAGTVYVLYRVVAWLWGRQGSGSEAGRSRAERTLLGDEEPADAPDDPVERLHQQYVDGTIDEAELDRRLDRHFDHPLDRPLDAGSDGGATINALDAEHDRLDVTDDLTERDRY